MSTIKVDNLQTTGGAGLYPARAWVNFDGNTSNTIRGSGNVSSATDAGVGIYAFNFSFAMQDANYSVSGSSQRSEASSGDEMTFGFSNVSGNYSTTSVSTRSFQEGGGSRDVSYQFMQVTR